MIISVASMIIGLGSLCFTATTRASRPPEVQGPISTTEVRIVDDKGKPRMVMATMSDGEPAIIMLNDKDTICLTIGINKGKPEVVFWDSKSSRMRLMLNDQSAPSLTMFRAKEDRPGVLLAITDAVGSTLVLSRQEGSKAEVNIGTSDNGSPDVTLISKDGKSITFDTEKKPGEK
jgi:hypothetical protein